jgi:penicillin-binding protein 1B
MFTAGRSAFTTATMMHSGCESAWTVTRSGPSATGTPAAIASIYPLQKEDRTLVRIAEVPPLLVTGLQAVEDRHFKHHPGVDLRGIARAALANLKAGRAVQGGSTLTQQLVKNYFLSHDRTLVRKFNEAIMSLLLEAHYDKGEILEAYLNEIFLGQQGAYAVHGFGQASLCGATRCWPHSPKPAC